LDELRDNDFVYRWNLRNVLARDYNLKVKFDCALDTNAFTMTAAAYALRSKVKEPVCEGLVVWTGPNILHFDHVKSKKNSLTLENGYIYLGATWGTKFFRLSLKNLASGKFEVDYCAPRSIFTRKDEIETFRNLQRGLRDPELYKKLFGDRQP
ncbi:MAG: hypothetical protein K2M94_00705, partial [Paramuribaculum sp.]|nr:hypothetical protein [Paramuribaculum sp.]